MVWVDLAPLTDPALVPAAVATAVGLTPAPGQPIADELARVLRPRQTLLLLDNCEHLLAATAALVAALLGACPALQVLATSRAPLRVRGEHEAAVDPLPVPPADAPPDPALLADNEAVRLFLERARAVRPTLPFDEATAATVAAICRALDGLPLAIELAAARVKLLSPEALLAQMQDRLRLLRGGARDLPPRQQTMRDAIAWSYDLLGAEAAALFRRLGIFVGGFDLEAAAAVAGRDAAAVAEHLEALLDQSLVRREERADGGLRFGMLETIREFALDQLVASGEHDEVAARHAAYFVDLVQRAEAPLWDGQPMTGWVVRSRNRPRQHSRRAGLARRQRPDRARADGRSPRHVLVPLRSPRRGAALVGRGADDRRPTGRCPAGGRPCERPDRFRADLPDAGRPGAGAGIARAGSGAGGRGGGSVASGDRAVVPRRRAGERGPVRRGGAAVRGCPGAVAGASNVRWWAGHALFHLGLVAYARRDWDRAVRLLAEAVRLYEAGGGEIEASDPLHYLALIACERGDFGEAAGIMADVLRRLRRRGSEPALADGLADVATLAAFRGDFAASARLFGAAARLLEAGGGTYSLPGRDTYERAEATARHELTEEAWLTAFAAGRALPLDRALAEAEGVLTAAAAGEGAAHPPRAAVDPSDDVMPQSAAPAAAEGPARPPRGRSRGST